MWGTAAAVGGGALLGGALDMVGANQQNIWNARAASAMMDFQREMASTQHQREVEDLKKAGLNPILSAGGGGAAAPSGAMATAQNALSGAGRALGDVAPKMLEAAKVKADTAATQAAGKKAEADAVKSGVEAQVGLKQGELLDVQKRKAAVELEAASNALVKSGMIRKAWEYVGSNAKGIGESASEDFGNAVKGHIEGMKNDARSLWNEVAPRRFEWKP